MASCSNTLATDSNRHSVQRGACDRKCIAEIGGGTQRG